MTHHYAIMCCVSSVCP